MEQSKELVKYEVTMAAFNERVTKAKKRKSALDIPEDIIACVLEDNNGSLEETAKELKCTLHSLIKVSERNKTVRAVMITKRMLLVDKAEKNLEVQLDAGSFKATVFTLKTLGKRQGYYEKTDVNDPIDPTKDPSAIIHAKVDLANLTTNQLTQLGDLLKTANKPLTIIGSSNKG